VLVSRFAAPSHLSISFSLEHMQLHAPPARCSFLFSHSLRSGPGQDDKLETIAVRDAMTGRYGLAASTQYFLDEGGQHSEKWWGARVWRPLEFFYPPTARRLDD